MPEPVTPVPLPLTERRRLQTQLEIARCAAELFAERGSAAVTAEDIATAAGIGLRTFYRYFRTKEEAVTPLLAGGVRDWIDDLAGSPREGSVVETLVTSARRALSRSDRFGIDSMGLIRDLLRAVPGDPALESVWFRVIHDTEESLVSALGGLMGPDADPLDVRLTAVVGNTAMRLAIQTWAGACPPTDTSPADIAERCIRTLTAGISGVGGSR